MKRSARALLASVAVFAALLSCFPSKPAPGAGAVAPRGSKPLVAVSVLPQAYFVSRVAGDSVEVLSLVGPGQNYHNYDPTPRQMALLSKAALWLTLGVDFEKALKPKVAALYPKMLLVDSAAGVKRRTLEAHVHRADENADAGPDQHVWLGREAAKIQAANIRDALSALDPAGASAYAANCAAFLADIDRVFEGLKKKLEPLAGSTVFVFHPSFGYFMDEFGIKQEAVETGGKEPTQKDLAALIEEAKADGTRTIFVQKQFPTSAAETVARAIGGKVVEIDPLAPDWLDNLGRMAEAMLSSK